MSQDPLKNKIFVITGVTEIDRDELKIKIIQLGGKCTTSLSKKTNFLVIGEQPGPSKLQKAKRMGIEVLTEEQLMNMLTVENDREIKQDEDVFSSVEKIEIDSFGDSIEDSNIKEQPKNTLQWSEKYRPKKINELIGNTTAIQTIVDFINGSMDKNCLFISGSPGLGKTTAVHVACKENDVEMVEFNGSDVRNKKSLISNVRNKTNIITVFNKRKIVVMDEVDGMTSDRGGIAELVQIIKNTKSLFICIANDKSHQKLKTLLNISHEVIFRKPLTSTILPRLKLILKTEDTYLPDNVLTEICLQCNQDMRYILNTIQRNKEIKNTKELVCIKKDQSKSIFDYAADLFKPFKIEKKLDIFFEDYSFLPLFVYSNYACKEVYSWGKKQQNTNVTLESVARASDSISYSNVIDNKIFGSSQNYSLLPAYGLFSCVIPTRAGGMVSTGFPPFLGKMSTINAIGTRIATLAINAKMSVSDLRMYLEVVLTKTFKMLENGEIEEVTKYLLQLDVDKESLLDLYKYFDIDYKNLNKQIKLSFTKAMGGNKKSNIKAETKEIIESSYE